MKNKRKICAALMLISFMSHCATAADDEIFTGSCGEDGCVWTLNKTSGRLVFDSGKDDHVGSLIMEDSQKEFVREGVIANGAITVSGCPFDNFPNLKNISLSSMLYSVHSLMRNCPQVEELTFNGLIRSVDEAVCLCNGLKIINLGQNVFVPYFSENDVYFYKSIAPYCPSLISVNVAEANEKVKSVKGALLTMNGKSLITFPFGRTSKAVIPYGVEEALEYTFSGCPLMSVTIPKTVKNIYYAFDGCNNLSTINFFLVLKSLESQVIMPFAVLK